MSPSNDVDRRDHLDGPIPDRVDDLDVDERGRRASASRRREHALCGYRQAELGQVAEDLAPRRAG